MTYPAVHNLSKHVTQTRAAHAALYPADRSNMTSGLGQQRSGRVIAAGKGKDAP